MRIISYGGGVQSTALIVLATQGKIGHIDAALFANVGDDSEHPATITYVREVMQPWAKERGIEVHELNRIKRTGEVETLWGRLMKPESRSLPIPVRMSDTGAPGTRSCTADFKINVIAKWLKARGASADTPAQVCIGFSLDEAHRASNRRANAYEQPEHPLLDLHLNRTDCKNIIGRAGLPVPPKSACFFCPFHRPTMWAKMRRDEPELFQKSVELENTLNERRRKLGRDQVYLTRFGKPLADVIQARQADLPGLLDPDADSCDEGYCWT
jgi:PP-loop superfamily ATP-utilizing enzyme